MTQAEFEKFPRKHRPPSRNLTFGQFKAEQDARENKFDYEGTMELFCHLIHPGTADNPIPACFRIPYHLRKEDVDKAKDAGYLEPL